MKVDSKLLHQYGEEWITTIKAIYERELPRRKPPGASNVEIAHHLAWILEHKDGGWTAESITAFVRDSEEWIDDQALPPAPDPPAPPVPPLVVLPRLVASGRFFALGDGTPWVGIQASDFNLLNRSEAGEDIEPVLRQRSQLGYNLLRVWTAFDLIPQGIGRLIPRERPGLYEHIPTFLRLLARYGLYVELTGFAGPSGFPAEGRQPVEVLAEMLDHWEHLSDACVGSTNALLEGANEYDHPLNQGVPVRQFMRPEGLLACHASATADVVSLQPHWSYGTYHTNDLDQWWRKVGHNAMEFADSYSIPFTSNENTRFPDRDDSPVHAYDAAKAAALLCAGACFHSVHGKSSELWTGRELICAGAWANGMREVPLAFQRGQYHHRVDLEGPGTLRAYDRTLPDGRKFEVLIRV